MGVTIQERTLINKVDNQLQCVGRNLVKTTLEEFLIITLTCGNGINGLTPEMDILFRHMYAEVIESSGLVGLNNSKLLSLFFRVTLHGVVEVERKHGIILRATGIDGVIEIVECLYEHVFNRRRL